MEAATGDSDGKIVDSESGRLLIEIIHLSVKRVKNCDCGPLIRTIPRNFSHQGVWRIFFHTEAFRPLNRLTRFSVVGENAAHGSRHSINNESDSAPSRPPQSSLHLVPASDEETSRRGQAVCPLHLPKVCFPAHNQAHAKTTQSCALVRFGRGQGWAKVRLCLRSVRHR
jgi:hypothetical protein